MIPEDNSRSNGVIEMDDVSASENLLYQDQTST